MTSKSKLYELIQLSQNNRYPIRIDRPTLEYTDTFIRDTNTHDFTCTATTTIDGKIKRFTSSVFTSKKSADLDVCQKIFEYVQTLSANDYTQQVSNNTSSKSKGTIDAEDDDDIVIDKKLVILIDYENVSIDKELDRLRRFLNRVHVFIPDYDTTETESASTSYSDSDADDDSVVVIKFAGHASSMKDKADIVVRSTRRDAVDHYIGFYLGRMLGQNPSMSNTHSIHILSRDRFASCLSDFCENVTHNVDVDHLIETIHALR